MKTEAVIIFAYSRVWLASILKLKFHIEIFQSPYHWNTSFYIRFTLRLQQGVLLVLASDALEAWMHLSHFERSVSLILNRGLW